MLILAEPDMSIASIATANGRRRTRLGKLIGLACMAPDIVTAIVEGRQPAKLNAPTLMDIALPLDWVDQRASSSSPKPIITAVRIPGPETAGNLRSK